MSLSKVQKFAYLKSLLFGLACNVVEGFSLIEQNYDSCIEILKNHYGKTDLIINAYVNNLLNLDHTCKVNIWNLNNLGGSSTSYGHLLIPI